MNIRIVLVEPEHEGNIGSIARLMKNFGLSQLWLVHPTATLGSEAYARAVHADEILNDSVTVEELDKALDNVQWIVGTTSIVAKKTSNLRRIAITPEELATRLSEVTGTTALLFGREGRGLSNNELDKCDVVVSIPSSLEYRTLNVASASAIIFYELWKAGANTVKKSYSNEADVAAKDRLLSLFDGLVSRKEFPRHKRQLAYRAFKNIISRAFISRREAYLIMGVLRRVIER